MCSDRYARQSMSKRLADLGAQTAPFLPDVVEEGPHSKLSDGPLKHLCVPHWSVLRALNSFAALPPAF